MAFTWVDWMIIGIGVISSLVSLSRGFFREVLSLLTWIAAAVVAWLFSASLSVVFRDYIDTPSIQFLAAGAILFIAVLITGGLVNTIIAKLVEVTGLTGTDRVLGMVFGGLRGALLVVIAVGLGDYLPLKGDNWWQQSVLIPHFQLVADWSRTAVLELVAPLFSSR